MNLIYLTIGIFISENFGLNQQESDRRLVAIGDLHGGYGSALETFRIANVTNSMGHWIGGSFTTVVQTGDVIDRGPDTIKLYSWFIQLREEAQSAGGQFIQLLGNHELLNLEENYKDVSQEDIDSFGSKKHRKNIFSNNGWIGTYLRSLDIVTQVGTTLFAHGGIDPKWSNSSVDELNRTARKHLIKDSPHDLAKRKIFDKDEAGPLWSRYFAKGEESTICPILDNLLVNWNVNRMVVGHTINKDNRISTKCSHKFIMIDVAISSYYHGGHPAALEIVGDIPVAIYPRGKIALT